MRLFQRSKINTLLLVILGITIFTQSVFAQPTKKYKRMGIFIELHGSETENGGPVSFTAISTLFQESIPVLMTYDVLKAWQNAKNKNAARLEKIQNAFNLIDEEQKKRFNSEQKNNISKQVDLVYETAYNNDVDHKKNGGLLAVNLNNFIIYHVPASPWFVFVPKHFSNQETVEIRSGQEQQSLSLPMLKFDESEKFIMADNTQLNQIVDWADQRNRGNVQQDSIIKPLENFFYTFSDLKEHKVVQDILKKEGNEGAIGFKQEFLEALKSELPAWIFYLHGHGSSYHADKDAGAQIDELREQQDSIANLSVPDFQRLLKLFNTVHTELVAVLTCYAGGKNLDHIMLEKDLNKTHLLRKLDYTVAVISSGDTVSSSYSGISVDTLPQSPPLNIAIPKRIVPTSYCIDLKSFFETVERKASTHWLSNALEYLSHDIESFMPQNIPQIWLPHTGWFQAFLPPRTKLISELRKKEKELSDLEKRIENRPILAKKLRGQINALNDRIEKIRKESEIKQKDSIYLLGNVATKRHYLEGKKVDIIDKSVVLVYPEVLPIMLRIAPEYNSNRSHGQTTFKDVPSLNPPGLYFPKILSMKAGPANHIIAGIELVDEKNDRNAGVFAFMRDAFFDMNGRSVTKLFKIQSLTGFNDLLPLIVQERAQHGDTDVGELEVALKSDQDKRITLQDVYVRGSDNPINGYAYIRIIFTYKEERWEISYSRRSESTEPFALKFKKMKEYVFFKDLINSLARRVNIATITHLEETLNEEIERAPKPIPTPEARIVQKPAEPEEERVSHTKRKRHAKKKKHVKKRRAKKKKLAKKKHVKKRRAKKKKHAKKKKYAKRRNQ